MRRTNSFEKTLMLGKIEGRRRRGRQRMRWLDVPGGSVVKNSPTNAAGDMGLIPGSGRFPGVGNGNPLQYSCLENSMDREAWWATVYEVAKSQTQLSTHACTHGYHRGLIFRVMLCFPPEDSGGSFRTGETLGSWFLEKWVFSSGCPTTSWGDIFLIHLIFFL